MSADIDENVDGEYDSIFLFYIYNRNLSENFDMAGLRNELDANLRIIDIDTGQDISGYFSLTYDGYEHITVSIKLYKYDLPYDEVYGAAIGYFTFREIECVILFAYRRYMNEALQKLFNVAEPGSFFVAETTASGIATCFVI